MSDSDSDSEPPTLVALGSEPRLPVEQVKNSSAAPSITAGPAAAAAAAPPPVPVCLITGFLGAGKSTLVNHVLSIKHGYRCAVLLNEWADSADIEKALIKDPEGTAAAPVGEWLELENGCICCSAKSDMVKALESLLQQRERFDYVLIETTGLANPGPVAAALWTDAELESGVCLDAIVTVVDSRLIRRQLAEPRPPDAINEAQQQVAFADVILLNKTDLVSPAQLAELEAEIRDINSEAALVRCQRCEIDLGLILNTGIYSADAKAPTPEAAAEAAQPAGAAAPAAAAGTGGHDGYAHSPHEHGPQCGPSCSHASHDARAPHQHEVGTVTLFTEQPLSLRRLRHWLDELLWEGDAAAAAAGPGGTPAGSLAAAAGSATLGPGDGGDSALGAAAATADGGTAAAEPAAGAQPGGATDIMRIKGLLHVAGSERKLVLQGVHELYDVVEGPAWAEGEQQRSKLVFIGRRLDAAALRAGLEACAAVDGAEEP